MFMNLQFSTMQLNYAGSENKNYYTKQKFMIFVSFSFVLNEPLDHAHYKIISRMNKLSKLPMAPFGPPGIFTISDWYLIETIKILI